MITHGYWHAARAPRYSLSFAFPLLASYEILALLLSQFEVAGVRNGADVLLKRLFLLVGGRDGLVLFGLLLVGGGAVLVWRDIRAKGKLRAGYFLLMAGEALAYSMVFGAVASMLTGLLLPFRIMLPGTSDTVQGITNLSLPTQLMISLGAGIYEELLFRVLLVSGLLVLATRILHIRRAQARVLAVLLGALIFSAFHYVGPYGDSLRLGSFTFRAVAGVLFSALYILRGFGITAWTHALYDVLLAVVV